MGGKRAPPLGWGRSGAFLRGSTLRRTLRAPGHRGFDPGFGRVPGRRREGAAVRCPLLALGAPRKMPPGSCPGSPSLGRGAAAGLFWSGFLGTSAPNAGLRKGDGAVRVRVPEHDHPAGNLGGRHCHRHLGAVMALVLCWVSTGSLCVSRRNSSAFSISALLPFSGLHESSEFSVLVHCQSDTSWKNIQQPVS